MQNLGMRLLVAGLIFWGGLHVVGFGMIENGSAVRGNPVWEIAHSLFDLEWMIVKGLAFVVLAAVGIWAVLLIGAAIAGLISAWKSNQSKETHRSTANYRSKSLRRNETPPRLMPETRHWVLDQITTQKPYAAPVATIRELEPREIPSPPTPEELKKKAIGQIMGRK